MWHLASSRSLFYPALDSLVFAPTDNTTVWLMFSKLFPRPRAIAPDVRSTSACLPSSANIIANAITVNVRQQESHRDQQQVTTTYFANESRPSLDLLLLFSTLSAWCNNTHAGTCISRTLLSEPRRGHTQREIRFMEDLLDIFKLAHRSTFAILSLLSIKDRTSLGIRPMWCALRYALVGTRYVTISVWIFFMCSGYETVRLTCSQICRS